jgi:glutamate-1-semialdehyde 2,1-aminomutase
MHQARTPSRSRSGELFAHATGVLAGGVSSPVRAFKAVGGSPVFVARAQGATIFDVDGNEYIDLVGAWGPAIVGHAHPHVLQAVHDAAQRGLSFGACCESEAGLATIIRKAIPSCELIRFVNTGTEATMTAIRLARAATARQSILKFHGCYHGHVDCMLVAAGSGAATHGVPDSAGVSSADAGHTIVAEFNDAEQVDRIVRQHGRDIAAIVVEPVAGNMGLILPQPGFLESLRAACDRHGCLLIFDEVMTGFRVAWGGYQTICGVKPDLTCLGKIIGGGLPVAAVGGKRDIMSLLSPSGPVYQAGTYSGNPVCMAAGIATLELCSEPDFYLRLNAMGASLGNEMKQAADAAGVALQTASIGGMFGLYFSNTPVRNFSDAKGCSIERFSRFFHAMLNRGVWLPPSPFEAMFISTAHGERERGRIVDAARGSFAELLA